MLIFPENELPVIVAVPNSGIGNVLFHEMRIGNEELAESEKWGADGHPSAKAHAIMAEKLSKHIADQMDW